MKKELRVLLAALLVLSNTTFVYAEEESDSSSDTETDTVTSDEELDETEPSEIDEQPDETPYFVEEPEIYESSEAAEMQEEFIEESVSEEVYSVAAVNTLIHVTVNPSGAWKKNRKGWWYSYSDGSYPKDEWIQVNRKCYRFDSNGYMQTGWIIDQGFWFFCDSSGAMVTSSWKGDYYLGADGAMAVSCWIGSRYVGVDGKWIPGWGIGKWVKNRTGWWYDDGYGSYYSDGLYEINGNTYYFNQRGYMQTGWQKVGDDWYYFSSDGAMKASAWVGDYYLLDDGRMAVNADVDGGKYHVGPDGKWNPDWGIARWIKDSAGWRYNDGYDYYPSGIIYVIKGISYCFDQNGYMLTGWQNYEGERYYFLTSGAMKKSSWEGRYYLKDDGRMAHSEMLQIGTDTYLFNSKGVLLKGWQEYEEKHYYFSSSGTMVSSVWQDGYYLKEDGSRAENEKIQIDKEMYWFGDAGAAVTGWQEDEEHWYFLENNGRMKHSEWQDQYYLKEDGTRAENENIQISTETYWFGEAGEPVTGWKKVDGYWYYLENSGRMKHSEWQGDYYLLESGKMAVSTWVDNNTAFVDENGKVVPYYGIPHWMQNSTGWWYEDGYGNYPVSSFMDIDGYTYYFNERGYMVTGWYEVDSIWYHFESYGGMSRKVWVNMYYLKEDGSRAQDETIGINGTDYTFDTDGRWIETVDTAGWVKDENGWWYNNGDGTCPINEWADIKGKTYRFNFDGYMLTGWYKEDNQWYYMSTSGAVQKNCWVRIKGYWYYFHEDGTMAADEMIGDYYVGSDGTWVQGLGPDLTIASGVSPNHIIMRGIDISEHNGNIDLSQYVGEFVIIRIGYWTTPDLKAVRNMDLCDKYNIPYGVYLYDYTTNPNDAVAEAEFTLRMIKGRNIRCGVWFDMEDADGWKRRNGLTPDDPRISQICKKYCETIAKAGYHVGIYASYSWFGTYIKGCEDYDVWVAHWGVNDGNMNINLSNMASIHQYTSIPLDKNVMYVNLNDLK